ncbi:MAG: hypothetical protein ACFFC3_16230 [Candidatus Odinarchaeota archaeon]
MELNTVDSEHSLTQNIHEGLKCGICQNTIKKGAKIFKKGLSFGVVCEQCYINNSPDDLELMGNLFMAYGGYFGMQKDSDYSLYKVLKTLTLENNGVKSIIELNINFLHQALLHGVSPNQFRQGLKLLLD